MVVLVTKEVTVEDAWQDPGSGGASNTGRCGETSAAITETLEILTTRLGSEMTPGGYEKRHENIFSVVVHHVAKESKEEGYQQTL